MRLSVLINHDGVNVEDLVAQLNRITESPDFDAASAEVSVSHKLKHLSKVHVHVMQCVIVESLEVAKKKPTVANLACLAIQALRVKHEGQLERPISIDLSRLWFKAWYFLNPGDQRSGILSSPDPMRRWLTAGE